MNSLNNQLNNRIYLKIDDINIKFGDRYMLYYANSSGDIVCENYYLRHKLPINKILSNNYSKEGNFSLSISYDNDNIPEKVLIKLDSQYKIKENEFLEIVFFDEVVDDHCELKVFERVIDPKKNRLPRGIKKKLVKDLESRL